jgi:hypothetical protein
MGDYLLTFELDNETEQVSVHGDPAGLEHLAKVLLKLAEHAKRGECPHDHLFTEKWGGDEVYCWLTKSGAKPYEET